MKTTIFLAASLLFTSAFAQTQQQVQQQQTYSIQQLEAEKELEASYREKRKKHPISYPKEISVVVDLNLDLSRSIIFSEPELLISLGNCRQTVDAEAALTKPTPHAIFGKDQYLVKTVRCAADAMSITSITLVNLKHPERIMEIHLEGDSAKVTIFTVYKETVHHPAQGDEYAARYYDNGGAYHPPYDEVRMRREYFGNYSKASVESVFTIPASE